MKRFLFLMALAASASVAQAAIILDGAHLLQQTASGDYSGYIWSTTGCCALAELGIGSDPFSVSLINTTTGDLGYAVPDGTTHFVLIGQKSYTAPYLGVALFFDTTDGSSAPQIGAYGNPMATSGLQAKYDFASGVAAAGGLSYTSGGQTVTLSNFSFTNASGSIPIYATFDLTLSSSAPEPGTFALMGGAAVAFGLLRLRRKL